MLKYKIPQIVTLTPEEFPVFQIDGKRGTLLH